jgi:ribosomal protein S18 acetylase RimI-like enzyme
MPSPPSDTIVRRATLADMPAVGKLGALLVRAHHDWDPQRFMAASRQTAEGYGSFLNTQLGEEGVAVIVAEQGGDVIGYVYAAVEPRDWMSLRDEAGAIHDVVVDPKHRGAGVGRLLLDAALAFLKSRGMPRVVLETAEQNDVAQRLFAKAGFRRTMIEMTRELGD